MLQIDIIHPNTGQWFPVGQTNELLDKCILVLYMLNSNVHLFRLVKFMIYAFFIDHEMLILKSMTQSPILDPSALYVQF